MIAFALIVTVGVIVIAIAATSAASSKRKGVLERVAAELGGTSTSNGLRGAIDGVAVSLDYETRGSGSSSESWTYFGAALPGGYPLALAIDRHGWFDRGKIERGEMIDVIVGDRAFDDAFRIEGAPAEVVKGMLTPELRAYLMAHARVEVRTLEGPSIRIAVRTWLTEHADVQRGLGMTARLAASLRQVSLALDAQVPATTDGDAYRALPSDQPLRAARAARADEVARVEAVRRERSSNEMVVMMAIFALVLVGAVLGIAVVLGG